MCFKRENRLQSPTKITFSHPFLQTKAILTSTATLIIVFVNADGWISWTGLFPASSLVQNLSNTWSSVNREPHCAENTHCVSRCVGGIAWSIAASFFFFIYCLRWIFLHLMLYQGASQNTSDTDSPLLCAMCERATLDNVWNWCEKTAKNNVTVIFTCIVKNFINKVITWKVSGKYRTAPICVCVWLTASGRAWLCLTTAGRLSSSRGIR